MKEKLGTVGLLSDDNRSIAQFQENGMIYKGNNPQNKRLLRYNIDGAMIKEDTKKCDKALGLPTENILYLIELKGCDLKEATVQILDTINYLGQKIKDFQIHGRVVCSRIPKPDIRSTQVVRLERELAKRNGNFQKASRTFEETV